MKKKKNVVAIVQARMNSTRLPKKTLLNIMGKPMLWHIVNRLKGSRLTDKIIVATSTNEKDDLIEKFCQEEQIDFYRGQEDEVIDRIFKAAKKFKATAVVRITADCPLVDPKLVDDVVGFFLKNKGKYDYVSNGRPVATFPHGLDVEIISFALIERLWKDLKDPVDREWFTPVIFNNPDKYKIYCLKNKEDLSHLRLTVDYKEDLILIRKIFKKLYPDNKYFSLKDVLNLLKKEAQLLKINKKYVTHKDVGYEKKV